MASLPTGTVTFLFTDIEGSTRLLQQLGDRYADALEEHRRLLRSAFQEQGGEEVDIQGDAFFFAFQRAKDAVAAAVAAQRAIRRALWPEGVTLRVRMGVHTGEPIRAGTGYVGMDVHRAARICGAGHGGQILLSDSTGALVAGDLPDGVALRDLGIHRLKDLAHGQRMFQVVAADLPDHFPPLRALDSLPNNLPVQLTSFIGREREKPEVKRLLGKTRILTLTGSGGAGKTRLALQVAAEILDQYPDGVWLVELAALSDPSLVPNAVASALNVPERRGSALPIIEILVDFLSSKSLLLVVDNCEHLLPACADLGDRLLRSCPNLRLLATSREALGVPGEVVWRVPSLSFPDSRSLPSLEHLIVYEAVCLFIERAVSHEPGFVMTSDNAPAVVQVCQRLDGIPLAIELAAARVKVLAVEQIATRLDDRFRLLTGGGRMALPRHQTLRATMDWSYDLLSEKERTVLRRLSVFAGGCTLEAAEAVCAWDGVEPTDTLNLLAQSVDKSLVVVEVRAGEARYRLLETVRQYGLDRLAESGEEAAARRRHLQWYMELGEQVEPRLRGPEQKAWLDRLETEHDNIRAALEWSGVEAGGDEAGLRLAGSLYWFWFMHGHTSEGRRWLEKVLSKAAHAPGPARAKGLMGVGILARRQGDYKRTEESLQASVVLFRESEDKWGVGLSLHHLAHAADECDDYGRAKALFEESLASYREAGDQWGVAASLNCLGEAMQHRGDFRGATPLLRESLALCRKIGDSWLSAYPVRILGIIAAYEGDYQTATALLEESLTLEHETGDKYGMAQSQNTLGIVASHQGRSERATTLFKESLVLRRELGSKVGIADCMERLGGVAADRGHCERAACLFGAAEALRESIGAPLPPVDRADYDRNVGAARAGLGEGRFVAAWAEGRAMTLEQAIEYALAAD